MKIIIIGPAHPYRGGIADTNESLCQTMCEAGHDASIITFTVQYPKIFFPGKTQFSEDPKPENIKTERYVHSINPFSWFKTAKKINKEKPDLVLIRYWIPLLAPSLGSIARLINKNIVKIAMCDNVIPHEKRLGDISLTKYFIRSFDGFITLSNTTIKELDQFTQKKKTYFPHPINKNLGEKKSREEARKYLNLDQKGKYLLFFGLVRDYKGLDLTLQSLGAEKLKSLNIQLIIAGEFYEDPEKYHKLINELGIQENVLIVNKFIPTEEIKYYFSASDMIIQTYKTASQSGVSQIAFHFDCPILVTNVGGLSEIVLHNKVGYVCEKDPAEISECIADFYESDRAVSFTENIKEEKKKYTWEAFTESLLNLYTGLMKNKQ